MADGGKTAIRPSELDDMMNRGVLPRGQTRRYRVTKELLGRRRRLGSRPSATSHAAIDVGEHFQLAGFSTRVRQAVRRIRTKPLLPLPLRP